MKSRKLTQKGKEKTQKGNNNHLVLTTQIVSKAIKGVMNSILFLFYNVL